STATGARLNAYDESAISPVAGIVFKPISNVSLYGNFTSGLTRGGIAPATPPTPARCLRPTSPSNTKRASRSTGARIITSASVFQITRPNSMTDPDTRIYSFDGEQRNRGLELSAFGEAMPGLRMMASATFYDATLKRTAGGVNDGNEANGVPKNTFNLGVDWDTPLGARPEPERPRDPHLVDVLQRGQHADPALVDPLRHRRALQHRDPGPLRGVPREYRNLFNKDFWLASGSYATVAAPRTFLLSAQIDF
ncbi:TonB-dependent siderophore receptor, partial [Methylobacterium radiotolerans]